jgi:hypothetical protein
MVKVRTIPNGRARLVERSYVRDLVPGLQQGADLPEVDPRVGRVMHDRADDDAHHASPSCWQKPAGPSCWQKPAG